MIILDTSIWIDFFRGNDDVHDFVSSAFQINGILGLPWIFGELLQGAKGVREIRLIKEMWEAIPKPSSSLSEAAWIAAGERSSKSKWFSKGIGLIDAAIATAAEQTRSKVWTLDKNLAKVLAHEGLLIIPRSNK